MRPLAFLFLASVVTLCAQDVSRMDEAVQAQAKDHVFMGAVLVARDGQVIFDTACGLANAEWDVPNTTDTRFRVGSVTKQFTAAAFLRLAEQGKLSLDDPAARYVEGLPPAWAGMTLRHLLNHTSGIPEFSKLPDYADRRRGPLELDRSLARLFAFPLESAPGEKFSYSNSGYILLSHILERVTGRTYGDHLREEFFAPLDLADTAVDHNGTIVPRRAAGYYRPKGKLANAPFINMDVPLGAGALRSTTRDLWRWTEALMAGKVVSPASLAAMTNPGQGDYGLGLVIRTKDERRLFEHGGSIEGFTAHLRYYPETRITVVVLANVNSPAPPVLADQLGELAHGGASIPAGR